MTVSENILSVIPGASDSQRLVILHRSMEAREAMKLFQPQSLQQCQPSGAVENTAESDEDEAVSIPLTSRPFCEQVQSIRERPIVLRQESFSPAVGWFTQSEMELTNSQWAAMKMTMLPSSAGSPAIPKSRQRRPQARSGRTPQHQRILSPSGEVISLAISTDQAVPA